MIILFKMAASMKAFARPNYIKYFTIYEPNVGIIMSSVSKLKCNCIRNISMNKRSSVNNNTRSFQTRQRSDGMLVTSYPDTTNCLQNVLYMNMILKRTNTKASEMDINFYEKLAEDTLTTIEEIFERVGDLENCPSDFDIASADGVLTVKLGGDLGTYVINKQTPNRQIWLSSPFSGPKRYDYVDNRWIYLHNDVSLDDLLTQEISKALDVDVEFKIIGQDSL